MNKISFLLAAIALQTTMLAGCSSDDTEPETTTWSLKVTATKGSNETATEAPARALTLNGSTLTATWATTETVYVKKKGSSVGTLQPQLAGAETVLAGELTGTFVGGTGGSEYDILNLTFPRATIDYTGQAGTLADVAEKYDYALATIAVRSVDAQKKILTTDNANFENQQAIVRFNLMDKDNGNAPLFVSALTVAATGIYFKA